MRAFWTEFPEAVKRRGGLVGSVADNPQSPERRYSPAECIGTRPTVISGQPDPSHISTSFVERLNWTTRTTMRRYTRPYDVMDLVNLLIASEKKAA